MSAEDNVRIVKQYFEATGRSDKDDLLSLVTEDIEWIIPGEGWPLAGVHRGHEGLTAVLRKASETMETHFKGAPEFIAQGDRVVMTGSAYGKVKATGKSFEDDWVFVITVRDGRVAAIREYIDTQALARASRPEDTPAG